MTMHHQQRRPAREADVGFLISIARGRGLFVHERSRHLVDLQDTRSKTIVFTGTPALAVEFLQARK